MFSTTNVRRRSSAWSPMGRATLGPPSVPPPPLVDVTLLLSNISFHAANNVGVGPFSPRILERYGVSGFSQFVGAEMMAAKYEATSR